MASLPPLYLIAQNVSLALSEDIGYADWTAQLISPSTTGHASVIANESAVVCGQAWFDACFAQTDTRCTIDWLVSEGELVKANTVLCKITGSCRALLTAERTALNFLQTLSGVATETHRYAQALASFQTILCDTRKTLPGLRLAEKYAVTVGGGHNQRLGLYDGILIKENHIAAAGSIAAVLAEARRLAPSYVSVQIEVETLDELRQALEAGASSILLDNMDLATMAGAVKINQNKAILEASGQVNIDTIRAIAQTGVHRISIGALTKHIRAIDLSMRLTTTLNAV